MLIRGCNSEKLNNANNSDMRLIWDGSHLLPRVGHTVISRYRPMSGVTGYFAYMWHSPLSSWDSGAYSFGTHPWPGPGTFDSGSGQATGGTGDTGTVHFWECAGVGAAVDYIANAAHTQSLQVVYDKWYVQIRRCRQIVGGPNNGLYEHSYIPDYLGNPGFEINVIISTIDAAPVSPAFYIGGSFWQSGVPGATQNNENTQGIWRGLQLYSAWLDSADYAVEALNDSIDAAQTSNGATNLFYINQNPYPDDITDKKPSGTLHTPRWGTSFRPSLFNVNPKTRFDQFPIRSMRRAA